MKLYGPLNSGNVSDPSDTGEGSSNQDSNHPIKGRVVGVYIETDLASESAPTVTITTKNAPTVTILNVATDSGGWYYPRTPIHDPTTGAVIANLKSDGIPIDDFVNVALSNGFTDDNVNVWLMLE